MSLTVESLPTGGDDADAIDFSAVTLLSFPGQDVSGTAVAEDGGATLHLAGNTWKRVAFAYTVTADTVLSFDYRRDRLGELHGIGLDNGEAPPWGNQPAPNFFIVDGSQSWGEQGYRYAGSGDWQRFEIPVGQLLTGSYAYLVFVNDDDAGRVGEGRFRNVRLYESSGGTPPPPPPNTPPVLTLTSPVDGSVVDEGSEVTLIASASDAEDGDLGAQIGWSSDRDGVLGTGASLTVSGLSVGTHRLTARVSDSAGELAEASVSLTVESLPTGGDDADAIDFSAVTLLSFPGQDVSGTAVAEDGGATLHLAGNTWKRVAFAYTVTADTVLSFDYRRDRLGELHGIGLDNGEAPPWGNQPAPNFFIVDGSQSWGEQGYRYAGSGDWQRFEIPVGQLLTGSYAYLVFVNDDDAGRVGEGRFRNVRLYQP